MSTRRSRIQIKPNLGRKSDGPAASGPRKPAPPAPAAAPPPPSTTLGSGDSVAVTQTIAASAGPAPAPHEPSAADQPDVASVPEQPATVPAEEPSTPTAAPAEPPCAAVAVAESPVDPPDPPPAEPAVTTSPPKRPAPVVTASESPQKVARPSEAPEPSTPQQPVSTPNTPSEPRTRKAEKQVRRRSRRTSARKPPTDRSAMTMQDLIYYNPPGNPMPEKASKTLSRDKAAPETGSVADVEEQEAVDDVAEQEEDDSAEVGPRVRLGPNGEITLDEESLVIRRQVAQPSTRAIVYETGGETNYASFRKNAKGRRTWTPAQTARFYRALSVCGTDFTLMATFFPKRTRQDLKNKFKREERRNRELVDRTINDPTQFDPEGLEEDTDEPDEPEPVPKRGRGRKRKTPPTEDVTVQEEVVEEEVVHEEIIIQDEPEPDKTAEETSGHATGTAESAVTVGPLVPGSAAVGTTPPLRLQAGQLVFYASRTQEQVVHVFVVAPPQGGASSELAARLSSPPLPRVATAPPSAAS
ncbi:transcription factor TFIIIB component B'' homolog [Dermacentor albipictus]|uniref:transcription factor TFIIIB component B'' homolog n=1 Tax=Dermacentor albipictus TaxID=60249 RepID=UPI0038FD25A2